MKTIFLTKVFILIGLLATFAGDINSGYKLPSAKVTIKVIDENGKAVGGAKVEMGFDGPLTRGVTDISGIFTAEGPCNVSGIGSRVLKDGYYQSSAAIPKFHDYDQALNRWEPWNKTYNVILRPIINPIPLFSKTVQVDVPALGKLCGYDLEVGDWVAPYGQGRTTDFAFKINKQMKNSSDFDIKGDLTFSDSLNGLQAAAISEIASNSIFRWPRQAPESGYESEFHLQYTLSIDSSTVVRSFKPRTEWEGYFFRVRSTIQDGKLISAHYGKIRGGIEMEPRGTSTCTISFTYYYNPTPLDKNLEWDTHRDLFTKLGPGQRPRYP
jgi:hypothetical protein